MSFKAVFLDAGGTLLRERLPRARIYAQAARRRGLAVSDEAMVQWMYRTHAELSRTPGSAFRYTEPWFETFIEHIFLQNTDLAPDRLPDVQTELLAHFGDPASFELVLGARELVTWLAARQLGVVVCSNWSERLPEILDGLGLGALIDGVVVSAIERVEKPDPAIFECARARLAQKVPGLTADPQTIVHLGDRIETDVIGAHAAGIQPVLYDPDGRACDLEIERVASLDAFRAWLTKRLA